jgi:hypothetical protein
MSNKCNKKDTSNDAMPLPAVEASVEVDSKWSQHEHLSDQVNLEAAKLLELAGSEGLANLAITTVAEASSRACDATIEKKHKLGKTSTP